MSYVLHIWEQPVPATFEEATAAALDHGCDVVGQNPGFLVLAGRLKARFPCLMDDDDAVWSDGPLDGVTDERALVLGISRSHEEVIAFVIECAARLKLCVFDMQQAAAWLPDGRIMGPGAPASPTVKHWSEQLDARDVEEAIYAGLLRTLGAYGFRLDTGATCPFLRLDFADGYVSIAASVTDYKPNFPFSLIFTFGLDPVSRITHVFDDNPHAKPEARGPVVSFSYAALDGQFDSEFEIQSRHALALALIQISQRIVSEVLPLLERCTDVRGLDAVWDDAPVLSMTGPAFKHWHNLGRLTVAKLAGNPAFDAHCERMLDALHPARYADKRVLARLIDYLRRYDPAQPAPLPVRRYDNVDGFIEHYDGSQFHAFECDHNGQSGDYFVDANSEYRSTIIGKGYPSMAKFSLRLVRDLFIATSAQCRHMGRYQNVYLTALSTALLTRGGAGELALLVTSLPLPVFEADPMKNMRLPEGVAMSLASVCAERAENPLYAGEADNYRSLAPYFGKMAGRR